MSAEDIEYMDDYKEFPTKESALDWLDNYLNLDERNNLIRALEQKPRKGKWISKPHMYGVTYCSECDFELKIDDTNYCPNCGAKMEKRIEEVEE